MALVGGLLVAGPAFALTCYPTAHLNLRSGPGPQYPVVGLLNYNVRAQLTGCLADWSWCSLNVAGLSGWASAEYLVSDDSGQIMSIGSSGAQMSIPIVEAASVPAVVAASPPVGNMVVAPGGALVEAVAPPPEVVTYVTQQTVEPVLVNGEVVVGATLPAAVPLYVVPQSPYQFTYVNGQKVLVDPVARQIVYVYR